MLYLTYEEILTGRRAGLLERLARHPVHLAVGGDGGVPPQHADSKVHRLVKFAQVLRMMNQARAIVVVQPNYSHALTERTFCAMHRRAVVLSTPNAFLDEHFVAGEDYLRLEGDWSNLDAQIAVLDDKPRMAAMAESAWRK